jgi:dephospho-CoA kinase
MIIGITGSFGAGKGEVVEYLTTRKNFSHYSASDFITEEIERRKMSVDRNSMIEVANDLRAQYGPAYIIEALYLRAKAHGGDAVIESIRVKAEVERIKELGGIVIGVDADSKVRYERAYARKSSKDNVTYEEWILQEQKESNPHDPTKQDIFGALKESNYIISNNGTRDELHEKIETVFQQL